MTVNIVELMQHEASAIIITNHFHQIHHYRCLDDEQRLISSSSISHTEMHTHMSISTIMPIKCLIA
eukprot:12398950-Karenia_brevis.AAC.1